MVKWSNFHVTVQFNKNDESIVPRIREAVDALPTPEYLWRWLKHYDPDEKRQQNFTDDDKYLVLGVRLRAAIEHGGKQNRGVHVHVVIEIEHDTLVQMEKAGLQNIFEEIVGLTCSINCRFIRGDGEDKDFVLKYLSKEVPSYDPKGYLNKRLKSAFSGRNEEIVIN